MDHPPTAPAGRSMPNQTDPLARTFRLQGGHAPRATVHILQECPRACSLVQAAVHQLSSTAFLLGCSQSHLSISQATWIRRASRPSPSSLRHHAHGVPARLDDVFFCIVRVRQAVGLMPHVQVTRCRETKTTRNHTKTEECMGMMQGTE